MITTLELDDDGRPVLYDEDEDGNREVRGVIHPDDIPPALHADYERLRDEYQDSLQGGHEAEARHAYLWGIGAL